MPVPTATIEHMFDIAVSAGDCDTPEATARELVNAARDADRAVRVAQARRAQMVVRAVPVSYTHLTLPTNREV